MKKKKGRLALPPETAARKKEMSSVALIVEFTDGNSRLYWTNEFSANFPSWKKKNIQVLTADFKDWDFFKKLAHRVKSAAIFDTRTVKELKQEYKLIEFQRGVWSYTNYAQAVL